jgi:hypothetical protein
MRVPELQQSWPRRCLLDVVQRMPLAIQIPSSVWTAKTIVSTAMDWMLATTLNRGPVPTAALRKVSRADEAPAVVPQANDAV